MSWHFSQALGAAYSEANSSDGAPFAPSSGTPTHGTCWSPGKTTVALKPSRSGMTFRPLTDDLGGAVLTWYLAASPVRTSPPPEKEPESKASAAACGSTWRESSVKYCLASSGWKTHQCLWEEDLEWSSLTLPKWGMMRVGVLWERTTPEHLTSETESGWWATPNVPNGGRSVAHVKDWRGKTAYHNGKKVQVGLESQVKMWPTPDAQAMNLNADPVKHMERLARLKEKHNNGNGAGLTLGVAVKMWPTPCAAPNKNRDTKAAPSYLTGKHGWSLAAAVHSWATPQSRDFRTGQQSRWENPERTRNLNDQIGGQLNPTWVEWLMGWPLGWTSTEPMPQETWSAWQRAFQTGWTDCAASAMAKFQPWCHSHGISCPPNPLRTEN